MSELVIMRSGGCIICLAVCASPYIRRLDSCLSLFMIYNFQIGDLSYVMIL